MDRCFVIQPFDEGPFDARYDEVLDPAIRGAGLEAYRVDRDPKAGIPIEQIESQIRSSRICLADITLDNPNVWFELGFAIAAYKDVVLICSDARTTKFPFDVQHRTIIKYKTSSPGDFATLQGKIQSRISALLDKEQTISAAAELSKLEKIQGLEQHEVVALAAIGENIDRPSDTASAADIRREMERSGFTKLAATIAFKSLLEHDLITQSQIQDEDGYLYAGFTLTDDGWAWILGNKSKFVLKRPRRTSFDDDIPF